MSDDAASRPDFDQFLAEYYVECDEHLNASRRSLLALEPSIGKGEPDRLLLDELFRSFHSIKGLSAMVGVGEAEALAHHLENYLGELRKGRVRITANGLEALIAGVKTLDHMLAARRSHTAGPDSAPVLADLAALVRNQPASAPDSPEFRRLAPDAMPRSLEVDSQIAARLKPGALAWHFSFVPAPALAERGITVNGIRDRLQGLGEILHAAPVVRPGGQISFSFIVGTAEPEAGFQAWQGDGLTYRPYLPTPALPDSLEQPSTLVARGRTTLPPLASNTVRVDLSRLDDLMQKVGELVLSRARLEESVRELHQRRAPLRMARVARDQSGDGTSTPRSARRGHARPYGAFPGNLRPHAVRHPRSSP